jgi:membrane-bound lytic murein transglycosylase D
MRGSHAAAKTLVAFTVILNFALPALADEIYGPSPLPKPAFSAENPELQSEASSLGLPAPEVVVPAPERTTAVPAPEQASIMPEPTGYGPLELPPAMLPRVRFWVDVYAHTFSWEYRIHDTKFPQLTYSVFNTKGKPRGSMVAEKLRVLGVLRSLKIKLPAIQSGKLPRKKLSLEEIRILGIFEANGLVAQLPSAAVEKRVRGQAGMRDALEDALFISGRYLPRMEKVFEDFGLPREIAYLPFVESGFNKKAVSKVGASGIWQFMPYTGKLYLRVDDAVDERNDPMRAAEAAARLMRQNYNMLEAWPLAMTAYNHGPMGVARAVREVGSRNLADIIDRYEGKTFGFASQNFYASFMGALHVAKHSDIYLGAIPRARKLEFDQFIMPDYMEYSTFLERMGIEEPTFRELNMALTKDVIAGNRYIPVGYMVRVPTEFREDFLKRYMAIPPRFKLKAQKGYDVYGPPAPAESTVVDPDLVE